MACYLWSNEDETKYAIYGGDPANSVNFINDWKKLTDDTGVITSSNLWFYLTEKLTGKCEMSQEQIRGKIDDLLKENRNFRHTFLEVSYPAKHTWEHLIENITGKQNG
jgi:hypothetical protein